MDGLKGGEMNVGNWESIADLNRTFESIRSLGLERSLAELETFGLTVVEGAATPEFIDRLRNAVLRVAADRGLIEAAPIAGRPAEYNPAQYKGAAELLYYMLFEDRVFEEAVMNPSA